MGAAGAVVGGGEEGAGSMITRLTKRGVSGRVPPLGDPGHGAAAVQEKLLRFRLLTLAPFFQAGNVGEEGIVSSDVLRIRWWQ
jgi:hypothetical protein